MKTSLCSYNCNQLGHKASECVNIVQCRRCGEAGHKERNCVLSPSPSRCTGDSDAGPGYDSTAASERRPLCDRDGAMEKGLLSDGKAACEVNHTCGPHTSSVRATATVKRESRVIGESGREIENSMRETLLRETGESSLTESVFKETPTKMHSLDLRDTWDESFSRPSGSLMRGGFGLSPPSASMSRLDRPSSRPRAPPLIKSQPPTPRISPFDFSPERALTPNPRGLGALTSSEVDLVDNSFLGSILADMSFTDSSQKFFSDKSAVCSSSPGTVSTTDMSTPSPRYMSPRYTNPTSHYRSPDYSNSRLGYTTPTPGYGSASASATRHRPNPSHERLRGLEVPAKETASSTLLTAAEPAWRRKNSARSDVPYPTRVLSFAVGDEDEKVHKPAPSSEHMRYMKSRLLSSAGTSIWNSEEDEDDANTTAWTEGGGGLTRQSSLCLFDDITSACNVPQACNNGGSDDFTQQLYKHAQKPSFVVANGVSSSAIALSTPVTGNSFSPNELAAHYQPAVSVTGKAMWLVNPLLLMQGSAEPPPAIAASRPSINYSLQVNTQI